MNRMTYSDTSEVRFLSQRRRVNSDSFRIQTTGMAVACVASFTSAALGVGTIVTFAPDALVLAIVSNYL